MISSDAWAPRAACLGMADLFIAAEDENAGQAGRRNRRAKQVCGRCPVRAACLADALTREGLASTYVRAVVRGGMSPYARFSLSAKSRARLIRQGALPSAQV
ncbi:WhiB family transcriptional regulator [Streptomyces sp. NPDC050509]|uniref:WhiB family transcriptional regulator n=1 Tax=Streptomyces sp. NPDC050509 TaxID=3365620 RepID=UPI00379D8E46